MGQSDTMVPFFKHPLHGDGQIQQVMGELPNHHPIPLAHNLLPTWRADPFLSPCAQGAVFRNCSQHLFRLIYTIIICLYLLASDSEQREGKEPSNSPLSPPAVPGVGKSTQGTSINVCHIGKVKDHTAVRHDSVFL